MISMRKPILLVSFIVACTSWLSIASGGPDPHSQADDAEFVTYEAFGAIGDGVTDDLPAICEAHEYANAHGSARQIKARRDLPSGPQGADRHHRHRHRLEHLALHDRRHRG